MHKENIEEIVKEYKFLVIWSRNITGNIKKLTTI